MAIFGYVGFKRIQYRAGWDTNMDSHTDLDFNAFHDYLYKHGITIYPGVIPESNTFRVAVIGDLYEDDIRYALGKMKDYFKESM